MTGDTKYGYGQFQITHKSGYVEGYRFVTVMRHDWYAMTMCRASSLEQAIDKLIATYPGDDLCKLCGSRIPKVQTHTRRGTLIPPEDRRRYATAR